MMKLLVPSFFIGIRRRRQGLQGIECGVTAAVVGAHVHLQPETRAVKNSRTKTHCHQEQSVGHQNSVGEHRAAQIVVAPRIAGQPEPKVLNAIGRTAVVLQPALIGERGGLRVQGGSEGGAQERCQNECVVFAYHGLDQGMEFKNAVEDWVQGLNKR